MTILMMCLGFARQVDTFALEFDSLARIKNTSNMNNEIQPINTPEGEIVLYQPDENISLEVKLDAAHEPYGSHNSR